MKILFVSPEIERTSRGISYIIFAMMKAAKADGHEVGLLVGYPDTPFKQSATINDRIEYLYLKSYLENGTETIKSQFPGGIRSKRNLAKIAARRDFLKFRELPITQDMFNNPPDIAKSLDYVIKVPLVYQMMESGMQSVINGTIKKAIRQCGVDLVLTGEPLNLKKSQVTPAKLGQFIHDTMPIEYTETPIDNDTPRRFANKFFTAVNGSDILFTNSEYTTSKILEINPKANTRVIYGTMSSQPKEVTETAVLQNLGLTPGKYLVDISSVEKRKITPALFDAYTLAYPKIKMPLVIIGMKTGYGSEDIMKWYKSTSPEIQKNIIFTGRSSENEKYTLLRHARAFIWPTVVEGIGLPAVEAMSSGLPVLLTRSGGLPEAGGKAALYIDDPYNAQELSEAIVEITNNDKLREGLLKHSKEQIQKFTDDKFNQRFSEGLKSLEIG